MLNLKSVYDAAQAADAEVQQIMAKMITAFDKNTEEGKNEALALRPALDEAKVKAEEANSLYVAMRDASATSDAARNFVPVASVVPVTNDKELTRDVFVAMEPADQMKFIKDGGKLIDSAPAE